MYNIFLKYRSGTLNLPSFKLSRKVKIIIGAAVLLVAVVAAVFGTLYSYHAMFPDNPRFTLRHVVVRSIGWWNDKTAHVQQMTELIPGKTGLFQINLADIRARLLREPSIDNATVSRVLPDTIEISISERIPRALLGNQKSALVLDSNAVVMHRDKCLKIDANLPVIIGYPKDSVPSYGKKFDRLVPAVGLIMLTITEFPDIRIAAINAASRDYLFFTMYYKNELSKLYRVYIPVKNMNASLVYLTAAMPNVLLPTETRTTIDLRYEGRVTLK